MEKNPSEQKPTKVFEPQTTETRRSCTEQLIGLIGLGCACRSVPPPAPAPQQGAGDSLDKAFAFLWLRHTLLIITWSGI